MATQSQLLALFRAYAKRDDEMFRSVGLQIAAGMRSQHHASEAASIRSLLSAPRPQMVELPRDLAALIEARVPQRPLSALVLAPAVRGAVEQFLAERGRAEQLGRYGLWPARKVVMAGPPGTGKTATAEAIAHACGLPLMAVNSEAMIASHMGETGRNIATVFKAMRSHPGVYLFDEFDGFASSRGGGDKSSASAEGRRMVNAFLTNLENDSSDAIVVAATNRCDALDPALARRFDLALSYAMPTEHEAIAVACRAVPVGLGKPCPVAETTLADVLAGLSHAEIEGAVREAAKTAVLAGGDFVPFELVAAAADRRRSIRSAFSSV